MHPDAPAGPDENLRVRRIYEEAWPDDGARVLVDRLWPRGVSKDRAGLEEWCKEIAPSTELRTWYDHVPERFDEFARRYRSELEEPEPAVLLDHLRDLAREQTVTLLTATKQVGMSAAAVLADVIRGVA
ncbi:MAG TPA: DUF488 family protein [Acidimicrobiales bacterium]|nr:DUF488 family protein [Acidimicrobiales bacterium]